MVFSLRESTAFVFLSLRLMLFTMRQVPDRQPCSRISPRDQQKLKRGEKQTPSQTGLLPGSLSDLMSTVFNLWRGGDI